MVVNNMRKLCITLICAAFAGWAAAQSFEERLMHGNERLRTGRPEEAIATFRDLLIDKPESDILEYGIGAGQYHKALDLLEQDAKEDALNQLEEAVSTFDELRGSSEKFIRQNIGFNTANAAALRAKSMMDSQNMDETIDAFEQAIMQYEDVLYRNPDHEAARKNLDHLRYLLKKMLQNPQQQQEGQGQGQGEGENEEQNQQQSQNEQQQQQQQQQEGDQQQQQQGQQSEDASAGQPTQQMNPDRQTIEAILESLEELDRREQRRTRNQRDSVQTLRKWW